MLIIKKIYANNLYMLQSDKCKKGIYYDPETPHFSATMDKDYEGEVLEHYAPLERFLISCILEGWDIDQRTFFERTVLRLIK